MEVLKAIPNYLFIVIFDIIEFFYMLISNIICLIKKKKYSYEDIIAVEYIENCPPDFESDLIYNTKYFKIDLEKEKKNYENIIQLENKDFHKIIDVLKNNKIFKYNKYIFKFYITPFSELFMEDGGSGEEILIIHLKDNIKYEISSRCSSKRFDNTIMYIKDIMKI
ncbi:MAG: hypothetical protein E7310_04940 [Clostridiales bacterium]|nr:hypothetical protein [Clostridiales bacterium]